MQCRLRDRRSRLFSLGLRPCPLRTEIPPDSLNLLIMLCTVEGEISKSFPSFLWGTLFLNISIICSRICWQTGDPRPIFAPKGLDLSWMLLLYQIIITITCWHQLFQITSLFNQFTSLLALNCSCPNFFWNVLQVWMTGKDVYLQMTWSWPDKTWNILCSYCLQWNTSQSKFRNHYFLFLFAFSILSQLFLIWGCITVNCSFIIIIIIYYYIILYYIIKKNYSCVQAVVLVLCALANSSNTSLLSVTCHCRSHKQSPSISRICVILLNHSVFFSTVIWPQRPVSVLMWPRLPLDILFREIHLRAEMNLIPQHMHT